jgi:hypothetical protein
VSAFDSTHKLVEVYGLDPQPAGGSGLRVLSDEYGSYGYNEDEDFEHNRDDEDNNRGDGGGAEEEKGDRNYITDKIRIARSDSFMNGIITLPSIISNLAETQSVLDVF